MLFNTPTQFAVLALLLLVGWLFGFASHSGGKRWREAYDEEAVGRARDRDELDAQLRHGDARVRELEAEKAALEARNAELSDELERTRSQQSSVIAPALGGAAVGAAAATAARPDITPDDERQQQAQNQPEVAPEPEPEPAPPPAKRGWFEWGKSDDLTRLRGVDGDLAERLKGEKVDTFRELGNLSDQDEIALERRLDLPAGFIQREQLREQARLLAEDDDAGHTERFG